MCYSQNLIAFIVTIGATVITGDRLENIKNAESTAPYAGGHGSLLPLPYRSLNEYKNLQKGSAGAYSTAVTAAPSLHKSHHSPLPYNANTIDHHEVIPIVKHASEPNNGDGSYSYSYETANGISASEYGVYKPGPTSEEGIQSASGSYSYTGPDNVVYTITYTAGLEGFVPQGAHIPTSPPIPEAIQKILQFAGDNTKYNPYEDINSPKYTSALPTPFVGYNPNYNKITSLHTGTNEYKAQNEFTRK